MNKTQEALKMAIRWMKDVDAKDEVKKEKVIQACKEALEQPAQEPVASTWIHEGHEYPTMVEVMPVIEYHTGKPTDDNNDYINAYMPPYTKLYTHPAPEPVAFVWLERDEVMPILELHGYTLTSSMYYFLDDLFSKIAEKNTHPAPSWQSLSDDEIEAVTGEDIRSMYSGTYNSYRAIEQGLKEKNHG